MRRRGGCYRHRRWCDGRLHHCRYSFWRYWLPGRCVASWWGRGGNWHNHRRNCRCDIGPLLRFGDVNEVMVSASLPIPGPSLQRRWKLVHGKGETLKVASGSTSGYRALCTYYSPKTLHLPQPAPNAGWAAGVAACCRRRRETASPAPTTQSSIGVTPSGRSGCFESLMPRSRRKGFDDPVWTSASHPGAHCSQVTSIRSRTPRLGRLSQVSPSKSCNRVRDQQPEM
jgi:hypothetical protein